MTRGCVVRHGHDAMISSMRGDMKHGKVRTTVHMLKRSSGRLRGRGWREPSNYRSSPGVGRALISKRQGAPISSASIELITSHAYAAQRLFACLQPLPDQ